MRFGIIGLGVGEKHVETLARTPGCEIVALCDQDKEKLLKVGSQFSSRYLSVQATDLLNDPDIDAIVIASYDSCHFNQVIGALEANKHVFVEKPLCVRREELLCIHQTLKKSPGLVLSSNLILRHSPRFLDLKKRINNNELGPLYYLDADYCFGRLEMMTHGWRGRESDYSVMLGGGVHMVDLVRWLSRREVITVSATSSSITTQGQLGFPDFSIALLEMEGGLIAKVSANFGCVSPHFHQLQVFGSKATFVNTPPCGYLYRSRNSNEAPLELKIAHPGAHKGSLLASFVSHLRNGTPLEVTHVDVFRVMSVCFSIEDSIRSGSKMKVEYL